MIIQAAIRRDLAVNRVFINIPLQSGIALWAVEPEQAKVFDGNTFLSPPEPPSVHELPPDTRLAVNPTVIPVESPSQVPKVAASSKTPIIISLPPSSYSKLESSAEKSTSDPTTMLDPNGFPPIAMHEGRMYLSPPIFSTLTNQQLTNLQTLETKQALGILQAFVVNYFKTELKRRRKAEKASAAAAGAVASLSPSSGSLNGQPLKVKRPADEVFAPSNKVQKVG